MPTVQAVSGIGHSQLVSKEKPGLLMTDQLTKKTKASPSPKQGTRDKR